MTNNGHEFKVASGETLEGDALFAPKGSSSCVCRKHCCSLSSHESLGLSTARLPVVLWIERI